MSRPHVSLEELLAYTLDGEQICPTLQQHLSTCPLCQQQATRARHIRACLVSQIYRNHCPSATQLSFYAIPGALPAEEQRQIAEHLARCPLCAAEYAETCQFLDAS